MKQKSIPIWPWRVCLVSRRHTHDLTSNFGRLIMCECRPKGHYYVVDEQVLVNFTMLLDFVQCLFTANMHCSRTRAFTYPHAISCVIDLARGFPDATFPS